MPFRKKQKPPEDESSVVWMLQGVYYLFTGIWAIVGIGTFQKVTGPKVDTWLVKTVGAIVTVIGGVLLSAGLRRQTTPEMTALSLGSAASLGLVSLWYPLRGRISKIYWLDTLAEATLVGLWWMIKRNPAR